MTKNPEELLQKIKQLESELKKVKSCKRYGLVWEDKPEIFEEKAKNALPILKENKSLRIEEDENKPNNIIIEGDNYHSLSTLSYTHKGKIDVIYIDPPYNTGGDFIYNDNYVDKEDSYKHSKWLSFINKRLKLAKDLISNKGLIFISIDDNEQAQLKLLCDEIFGEKNFKSSFCWIMSTKELNDIDECEELKTLGANLGDKKHSHEYIFCYGKEKSKFNLILKNGYIDSRITKNGNNISILEIKQGIKCEKNITKTFYGKIGGNSESIEILNTEGMVIKDGILQNNIKIKSCFANPNYIKAFFNGKKVLDNKGQEIINIFLKNTGLPYTRKKKIGDIPTSVLSGFGDTSKWGKHLINIFGKKIFDYPKPFPLIKKILSFSSNKNSTILDFFAGSGTTGHAVMDLNKEDGGSRQFILCSSRENTKIEPEKNICKDITYERNKRIIEGYTNSKGEKIEGLGGNLRYYTTEFIKVDKSIDDLRYSFIDMCDDLLSIKENTFTEVKLKNSVPELKLFKKGYKVNSEGKESILVYKYTAILYDIHHFKNLVKLLEVLDGEISVYIFSLSKDIFEEELEYLNKNTPGKKCPWGITVQNIPDDILGTYKKIFNF